MVGCKRIIYLDNAATTPMLTEAWHEMQPWASGNLIGNPSSLHSAGRAAKQAVREARANVANLIGVRSLDEIIFTSGGTEADNLALRGLVPYLKKSGRNGVAVSAIEHHAILNQCELVSDMGMGVYIIPVDSDGVVDKDKLQQTLKQSAIGLVSIMLANNETGVVQVDMDDIAEMCHEYGALLHTDAVQAVGHMDINVQQLGVDLLSLSGHKFGGPDGIGALYVKSDVMERMSPIMLGGGQERGNRAGTENVAAIVGLGAAAKIVSAYSLPQNALALRQLFISTLKNYDIDFIINSEGAGHITNILSLTFPFVGAEALLHLMDADGVCMSAASACSAGSLKPSHVLTAIGRSPEYARSTIRVSFGAYNTKMEIEDAATLLAKNVLRLRGMYG